VMIFYVKFRFNNYRKKNRMNLNKKRKEKGTEK
jgi:hypothetical protein